MKLILKKRKLHNSREVTFDINGNHVDDNCNHTCCNDTVAVEKYMQNCTTAVAPPSGLNLYHKLPHIEATLG